MFNEISENKDDYSKFYEAFSKNIKLGEQARRRAVHAAHADAGPAYNGPRLSPPFAAGPPASSLPPISGLCSCVPVLTGCVAAVASVATAARRPA